MSELMWAMAVGAAFGGGFWAGGKIGRQQVALAVAHHARRDPEGLRRDIERIIARAGGDR